MEAESCSLTLVYHNWINIQSYVLESPLLFVSCVIVSM